MTAPDELMDANGYPTEAFLAWLKETPQHVEALRAAAEYFEACGYGASAWEEMPFEKTSRGRLRLVTGGWSGCEDVIGALMANFMLWSQYWEEHHRGGKWVFEGDGLVVA